MPQTIRLSISMRSPPSFSPVNQLNNLYHMTKSEATSCNRFRDIFTTYFGCPNLQRTITRKLHRAITKKKHFLSFSPSNLLIIFYQLYKFEAPSCNSFRDSMFSMSQFAKVNSIKNNFMFFSPDNLRNILFQLSKFEAHSCDNF